MNNTPRLVSAVLAYAERQHEESMWAIVWESMTRAEVAGVIGKYAARTPKQAIRAMRDHLLDQTALVMT